MNSWAQKRKRIIFWSAFLLLAALISIPAYFTLHRPPSCGDGKQNGEETGVDCGGSCRLVCRAESLPLLAEGDPRILPLTDDTYAVVVLARNPNVSAEVAHAGYTFKLYEANGSAPVKIIEGETFVPRDSTFAVFEGPFSYAERAPVRAVFEWKRDALTFTQTSAEIPELTVKDKVLSRENADPRLTARIANDTTTRIDNIELVALITNEAGNIIAASRTYVEKILPAQSVPVIFTWPRPFTATTTFSQIVPRILPDKQYIR